MGYLFNIGIVRQIVLSAFLLNVNETIGQNINLAGQVIDHQNSEPLPSATISTFYKGRVTATIANKDGWFSLRLSSQPDSVKVSMIGYRSVTIIGGKQLQSPKLTFSLEQLPVQMKEVVIKPLSARDIIRRAVEILPGTQPSNNFETTGFYREVISDKQHYFSVAEAVFTTQFEPRKKDYSLKLEKGRAKEDVTYTKLFEDYHPGGGPQEAMKSSFLVEIPAFLKMKELEKFDYKRLPVSVYDGQPLYVIAFDQKEGVKQALDKGTIFIDAEDFSIVKFETSTSPRGLPYIKSLTGNDKIFAELLGVEFKHKGWKRQANFVKVGTWTLLNYTETEYRISYKQPRKNLDLDLVLSMELLLSPNQEAITKKITKEEEWKRKDLVRNLPTTFDPAYWGMSATISPTEAFTEIVKGIMITNNQPADVGSVKGWNKFNEPLFVSYSTGDSIVFVPIARSHWEGNKTGPFLYRDLEVGGFIEASVKISKNTDQTVPPDNGFQQCGIMIRDSSAVNEHHLALTIGTGGSKKLKLTVSETSDGKKNSETFQLDAPAAWLKLEWNGASIVVSKKTSVSGEWQTVKKFTGDWIRPRLQAGFCSSVRFPGDAPKMRPDIRAIYSNIKIASR